MGKDGTLVVSGTFERIDMWPKFVCHLREQFVVWNSKNTTAEDDVR